MNIVLLLTLVAIASAVEYMPDPVDPLNVDTLPQHPEVVKARIDCLLDKQPCDELTTQYKGMQFDLVRDECAHCSPHLKHFYKVFIKAVKDNFYKEYQEYKQKYDPQGKHFGALEAAIANF